MFGLINLLSQDPLQFVLFALALVVAITIHEFAHAYVADRLGDPTPRIQDRTNLNPLSHLDPIGTIAILFVGFGWGKPVPYDPYNLENPKRDSLLIALAGPSSNFILATALAIIINLVPALALWLVPIIYLNVVLGVFNLLPVPPLDGSKILTGLLPVEQAIDFEHFANRYGIFLLLLFLLPFGGSSLASMIITPLINAALTVLGIGRF